MAYVRTVKTASGATAVQIVWSSRRGSRNIEHVGSAHDEAQVEALKAAAGQRIADGQGELDLGLDLTEIGSAPLEIIGSRAGYLWDGLCLVYEALGLDRAAGGDEVFRDLVLARIIEPTSKVDSLRVLAETGIDSVTYRTLTRRLPGYAKASFRAALSAACTGHAGLGPASLVLYDVTTLYFETDAGDGFRESGFSKERRLEPQITVGLLSDATGFPLAVGAFKGNQPETDTMLPVINAFKTAHQLTDVTVVADAGMICEANQKAITAAGLSFILGTRIPYVPQVICEWRAQHPGQQIPDQQVFSQPWPATTAEKARGIPDRVIYYQYRHDRARRTLRGIDEQVGKAEKAVAGKVSVKRNRFIKLTGAEKSVNRDLEAKARALAGIKGYTTNLTSQTAEFVIGAYHQLWRIEKSFRMSKHDLQARPIYHHKRESIEAHLSIVFAALAVSHWIEHQTGCSIKKFVQTLRRYRTVTIRAGNHTLIAADPASRRHPRRPRHNRHGRRGPQRLRPQRYGRRRYALNCPNSGRCRRPNRTSRQPAPTPLGHRYDQLGRTPPDPVSIKRVKPKTRSLWIGVQMGGLGWPWHRIGFLEGAGSRRCVSATPRQLNGDDDVRYQSCNSARTIHGDCRFGACCGATRVPVAEGSGLCCASQTRRHPEGLITPSADDMAQLLVSPSRTTVLCPPNSFDATAFRGMDLRAFDVVVVSHHAFATQAVFATNAPVIAYVHSPARWAWEPRLRAQEAGDRQALPYSQGWPE